VIFIAFEKLNMNDMTVILSEIEPYGKLDIGVRVVVFNVTFNNISIISWRSVLLVEESRIPRENHQPVVSH
jgi:hypothetical protein